MILKFLGGPEDGYECSVPDDQYRPGGIIEINRSKRLYATAIPLSWPLPKEIFVHDMGPARCRTVRKTR